MLQRFGDTLPEREVKFAPCDLKSVEADGTFTGYASLFNEVDLGQDLVMPGAFGDSLRLRGPRGVKLLFQHETPTSRSGCGSSSARIRAGCSRAAG
jgi:phage head maturation protease